MALNMVTNTSPFDASSHPAINFPCGKADGLPIGMWSVWSPLQGVGIARNRRINPMQSQLPMHRSPRCGARTRKGSPCQSPAMANGRCRMHGGKAPGAARGNRNALKHGRYTAEAVASRREVASLIRAMRALAHTTDEQD
jgi:hypothetical protein